MMTLPRLKFSDDKCLEKPGLAFSDQFSLLDRCQLEDVVSARHPVDFPKSMRLLRNGSVQDNPAGNTVHAQSRPIDAAARKDQLHSLPFPLEKRSVSFGESLTRLGDDRPKTQSDFRFGQLLVSSGIIDSITLAKALGLSRLSGMPLGRVLTSIGELSPTFLNFALNTQVQVRSGALDLYSAEASLGRVRKYIDCDDLNQTLTSVHSNLTQPPLLGQLLVYANALTATEISAALSISRAHDMMLGQVLIEYSWLDRSIVTRALQVQRLIAQSSVSSEEAHCILQQTVAGPTTRPFSTPAKNQTPQKTSVSDLQFLSMVGVITPEIIKRSLLIALRHQQFVEGLNKLALRLGKIRIGEEELINFTLADFPLVTTDILNAVTVESVTKESLMNAIRVALSNDRFVQLIIDFAKIVTPQMISLALQIKRFFCKKLVDLEQACRYA